MKPAIRMLGASLALAAVPAVVLAADHGDAPAMSDPTTDLTDLYAWMTDDTERLNLVLAVGAGSSTFSPEVTYAFTVSSSAAYGEAQMQTNVICKFIDSVNIECWAGPEYVVGDPSDPSGISSASGALRVFAGLRDDPFFLDYEGFTGAVDAALAAVAAEQVQFDPKGCPLLTPEQAAALNGLLTPEDPQNTFAGQNVLALVVQVDKNLVNAGGPILGISASTHSN